MGDLMNRTEKTIAVIVTLMFLIIMLISASRVNTETRPIWGTETVDDHHGRHISNAIDYEGSIHVSYCDYVPTVLRYAKRIGNNWTKETLFRQRFDEKPGGAPSMVLDSQGNPTISYVYKKHYNRTDYQELRCVRWSGTEWVEELVYNATDNPSLNIAQTSIALDANDNPHIAFFHSNHENFTINTTVRLSRWTGTRWQHEIVDYVNYSTYSYVWMDLDSQGNPLIIYNNNDGDGIKYARWSDNGWNRRVIEPRIQWGNTPSMVVDDTDVVHVSYAYLSEVRYARCENNSWTFTVVDDDVSGMTPIALDYKNNPHICYTKYNEMRYAKMEDNKWRVRTVVDGRAGANTLCIDADNNPHIIYNSRENGDHIIKYANIIEYDSDGDGVRDSDDSTPELNNDIIYLVFGFGFMNIVVILAIIGMSKFVRRRKEGENAQSSPENKENHRQSPYKPL